MTAVTLDGTTLRHGCTSPNCGVQRTVQLSPYVGRRCADHVTLPPGPIDRGLIDDMAALGRFDAALAYVGAWFQREAAVRFGVARARLVTA